MAVKRPNINNYLSGLSVNLKKTLGDLHRRFSDKIYMFVFVNTTLVIGQYLYLKLRFEYLTDLVPLWYTKQWGVYQLAEKYYLYLIPTVSLAVIAICTFFMIPVKRYYFRYGFNVLSLVGTFVNLILSISLIRIIFLSSSPFPYLLKPMYLDLIIPGAVSFFVAYMALPKFISYAKEHDLVTDPHLHHHPGMLLKGPSARGGGFVYGILFIILSIIFIGFPPYMIAFYISLFLLSLLGILDDYQNTHPESKLHFLENPFVRLFMLFLIVSVISTLGARIFYITSPFGGMYSFGSNIIVSVVTTAWIVWLLNVMSWSNGIDGQYGGIVGVASILILMLAVRSVPVVQANMHVAVLAAVSAGLSFGFVKYTWHPSKIMWGFGAMSAGLVLATLSILGNSKIITSIVIILIPFFDALVTVVRRIIQKKNPLKGDRGHLHHLLLDRGWSVRKIAVFYWVTTALFGGLGYLTADKFSLQMGLVLCGIAAFFIIVLNLGFIHNPDLKKD